MTKSCNDIQAETCTLYAEGKSLEYIRAHLRQARKFDASTRAFRLELKAWKAKRADTTGAAAVEEPQRRSTVGTQTHSFSPPGPQNMLLRHASDMETASVAGSTIDVSHVRTAEPTKHCPERAYAQLVRGEAPAEVLARCEFWPNITNVLHVAAKAFRHARNVIQTSQRDGLQEVLEHIMDHVRAKNCIDHRDELGDTALSIAVKASEPVLVYALLEHDASADLKDDDGNTPLHNAVMSRTPLSICKVLLSRGADVHITAWNGHDGQTALSLAVSMLDYKSRSAEQNCPELFGTIPPLMDAGAGWSFSDMRTIVRAFTRYWVKAPGSFELLDSAKPILKTYLAWGQDPTKSLAQDRADCSERSLAHCAFSHSPDGRLAAFLGQNVAKALLPDLIGYALKCAECPPYGSFDLTAVLHAMLIRFSDGEYVANASDFAQATLCYAPKSRKLPFLKTLTDCQPALAHYIIPDGDSKVLRALLASDLEDQWGLATILMQPQLNRNSSSNLAPVLSETRSVLTWSKAPLSTIGVDIEVRIRHLAISAAGVEQAVRLILHVTTKVAIEAFADDSSGSTPTAERVHEIVQLRKQYKLPELLVSLGPICKTLQTRTTGHDEVRSLYIDF